MMPLPTGIDFNKIVARAAQRFEVVHGFKVGIDATALLVTRAAPYTLHVERELLQGTITVRFLEDSVITLLVTAKAIAIASGHDRIDEALAAEAMEKDCPYLFWC